MARIAKKKKANPVQLYRHFAIVTIAITAVVGLFADGEAQKAVEQHQAAKAEKKRLANAEALSRGNRKVIKEGEEIQGTGAFASPTSMGSVDSGFSSSTLSQPLRIPAAQQSEPIWDLLGISKDEWDALPEDRKNQLKKELGIPAQPQRKPTAAEVRAIGEASRLRSGGQSTEFNSGGGADGPGADAS